MEYFLYSLLALVAVFFIVIIARTLAFKPKKSVLPTRSDTDFDADRASECLRELVKFKTISYRDPSLEDEAEFEGLIGALPSLYPHVFEKCEFLRLPNRALLFKWISESDNASGGVPGPNSEFENSHSEFRTPHSALEAVVLMAHYDVVPVSESDWEKPPFDGIIENGELWGRGTLDTKVTMNASLFAVDTLIARGYTPKRDIYLAYSGNEEINGEGAPTVIKYFEENGIKIDKVVASGGIAEKDSMTVGIYADILDRPITVPDAPMSAAKGSAIYGAVAAGIYENAEIAANKLGIKSGKTYEPKAENVRVYGKLYREYCILHDYFGRGENDLLKKLRSIKD